MRLCIVIAQTYFTLFTYAVVPYQTFCSATYLYCIAIILPAWTTFCSSPYSLTNKALLWELFFQNLFLFRPTFRRSDIHFVGTSHCHPILAKKAAKTNWRLLLHTYVSAYNQQDFKFTTVPFLQFCSFCIWNEQNIMHICLQWEIFKSTLYHFSHSWFACRLKCTLSVSIVPPLFDCGQIIVHRNISFSFTIVRPRICRMFIMWHVRS